MSNGYVKYLNQSQKETFILTYSTEQSIKEKLDNKVTQQYINRKSAFVQIVTANMQKKNWSLGMLTTGYEQAV